MEKRITGEEIRQIFYDIADEMERECGEWESLSENKELTKRILRLVIVQERRKNENDRFEKKYRTKKGILEIKRD